VDDLLATQLVEQEVEVIDGAVSVAEEALHW
jgi:hypothetical protein